MFKFCQNNVLTIFLKNICKMKFIFKTIIMILIIVVSGNANEIKVFEFTEKELSQYDIRKVRGADNKTIYTVGSNENGNFLKAVADNAASGLGKRGKN